MTTTPDTPETPRTSADKSASSTPAFLRRTLMVRLVEGRLPAFLAARVHARIRRDPVWSQEYDALRSTERVAAGSPAVTNAQRAMLLSLVEQQLPAPTATASSSRMVWAPLATIAAAAVVFVVTQKDPDSNLPDDLRARGGDTATLGFRARCLDKTEQRVLDEAESGRGATLGDPVLACPHGSLIAFSVTNTSKDVRHVFIVGVTPTGDRRYYAPFTEGSESVRVEGGTVDRVLDPVADTTQLPDDARVALFAVFSPAPLQAAEIAAAVDTAERAHQNFQSLTRLPLSGVDQIDQMRIDVERPSPKTHTK